MKKDLELLIEKEFFKAEKVLGQKLLNEIIIDSFFRGFKEPIKEAKKQKKDQETVKLQRKRDLTLKSIPNLSVSEMGWSSLATTADKKMISSEQRAELENYLNNIPGKTFEEKIIKINEFYNIKSPEELESSGFIRSKKRSSKIQKIISYLVFLKTLTTIITNFNASAAGFAFESFLGVLLGGSQIPPNTGTIADLKTKSGEYISLKLYSENKVKVGGSYVDLVNDMVDPKKEYIRYIVAVKQLSGEKLELQGLISVYSFNFNLQNVLENIAKSQSGPARNCIKLPMEYIKSLKKGKEVDFSDLKRKEVPDKELLIIFGKTLENNFKRYPEALNLIKNILDNAEPEDIFPAGGGGKIGYSQNVKDQFLDEVAQSLYDRGILERDSDSSKIKKAIQNAFFVTFQERRRLSSDSEMTKRFNSLNWASPEQSSQFYNTLDDEGKRKALKNTYGYIATSQFELSLPQVFAVMGNQEKIAEIVVGRKNIEDIINQMAGILDDEIFDIFDNLSALTENINTFFAKGLEDEEAANAIQVAARNIDESTEEFRQKMKQTDED